MAVSSPACDPQCLALAAELEERVGALWWSLLRGNDAGLSRSAAAVLAQLRRRGPQRVTDLAELEGTAQPTMSCLVDRLERLGLAERHIDPSDGRARRVAITAEGGRLLEQRAALRADRLGTRLQRMEEDERHTLRAALAALDHILEPGELR